MLSRFQPCPSEQTGYMLYGCPSNALIHSALQRFLAKTFWKSSCDLEQQSLAIPSVCWLSLLTKSFHKPVHHASPPSRGEYKDGVGVVPPPSPPAHLE